jgi:hypothetical protein
LEEQAWRLVPTLLPKLLGDLLREGLAASDHLPGLSSVGARGSPSSRRPTKPSCAPRSAKTYARTRAP